MAVIVYKMAGNRGNKLSIKKRKFQLLIFKEQVYLSTSAERRMVPPVSLFLFVNQLLN